MLVCYIKSQQNVLVCDSNLKRLRQEHKNIGKICERKCKTVNVFFFFFCFSIATYVNPTLTCPCSRLAQLHLSQKH